MLTSQNNRGCKPDQILRLRFNAVNRNVIMEFILQSFRDIIGKWEFNKINPLNCLAVDYFDMCRVIEEKLETVFERLIQ